MESHFESITKEMSNVDNLIKLYFDLGLSYSEILCFLAISDRIIISRSTLKRKLKKLNLFRRKHGTDIIDVALFIIEQLQSAGKLHGYRWMHMRCIHAGLNVPRNAVMKLLQLLDPEGVATRKRHRLKRRSYVSKGPNFVWHLDSYDKLKPFGIAINGCIDGFSRKMLWLEANVTNSDPKVIAGYYIKTVKENKGCLKRIRADMGTENRHVEQMQVFLRRNGEDALAGDASFLYGKSTHNQRIEWFWGLLRKHAGQFWMDFFKRLSEDVVSLFTGDILDKSLIQFCFITLLQKDLDDVLLTWNTHSILSTTNRYRTGNRPIMMYCLPELYNVEDCLQPVDMLEVSLCEEEVSPKPELPCDETVKELCHIVMEEEGFLMPTNIDEALDLYCSLRRSIKNLLE